MSIRRSFGSERGASLVEFALILPVFVLLVLGTFSGGLAYNQKLSIQHAAREGARFAATFDQDVVATGAEWAAEVELVVRERAAGDLPTALNNGIVCVALVDKDGNKVGTFGTSNSTTTGCYTDTSSTYTGNRVQVRLQRPARIELLFGSIPLTLTSRATARFER